MLDWLARARLYTRATVTAISFLGWSKFSRCTNMTDYYHHSTESGRTWDYLIITIACFSPFSPFILSQKLRLRVKIIIQSVSCAQTRHPWTRVCKPPVCIPRFILFYLSFHTYSISLFFPSVFPFTIFSLSSLFPVVCLFLFLFSSPCVKAWNSHTEEIHSYIV